MNLLFFLAEVHHEQPGLMDVVLDFKSNVINWVILVGFLFYGINKLVPPMLAKREASIKEEINVAERIKAESDAFFLEQKQNLENAQRESENIVDEAKVLAETMKTEIKSQTTREVADLQRKLEAAIANERQMIVTEVRSAAVEAAVKLSRSYLEKNVDEADNKRLLSQFVAGLDTLSGPSGQSYAPGTAVGATGRTEK
jgi:F-type H+-transporting ATPase subunit b